jgi:DNA repair photolyase
MALNEAKGNMYSWITSTWNTVKGECPHGCTYCYMKRWGKQKPVRFDESELKTDLGSGNFIFVGSSCDMWAKDIHDFWILRTLGLCEKFDNKYLFQTKNPARILDYIDACVISDKSVVCTTIETNRDYPDIMKDSPNTFNRAESMNEISGVIKTYVTIEPVMDFDLNDMVQIIEHCNPDQVNIGADSGNNHLPEPSKEKLLALIDALKEFTIIDKKTNLNRILNTK